MVENKKMDPRAKTNKHNQAAIRNFNTSSMKKEEKNELPEKEEGKERETAGVKEQ